MEMVQIFDLAKVALTTAVLLAAAVSDLRTRRVPDRTWVILGAVCAPLLFLEMGDRHKEPVTNRLEEKGSKKKGFFQRIFGRSIVRTYKR